jgi:hypothetical protein
MLIYNIKQFLWSGAVAAILCKDAILASPLDDWLLKQVERDEKLLSNALLKADGHSLEALRSSENYLPFFLEAPRNNYFDSPAQEMEFDTWLAEEGRGGFLPGGYIFRLRFSHLSTLYATSAGDWDGTTWFSPSLGKNLIVDPARVWNGSGNPDIFATMLAGAPPKVIVYDQKGNLLREESFDVNAVDLEQRVAVAVQAFAENGSPNLEMVSLADYLDDADATWKAADLSGRFNLRNQQQRDTERERLKIGPQLTRNEAVEALKSKSPRRESRRPHESSESTPLPQASGSETPPQVSLTPSEGSRAPIGWLVLAVVIGAALGLRWLLPGRQK